MTRYAAKQNHEAAMRSYVRHAHGRGEPFRKVQNLYTLQTLAETDKRYERLAIVAAQNLGMGYGDLQHAMRWLRTNAQETTEEGVIQEVNACRDLVEP